MPYEPQPGGYKWRSKIAQGRALTSRQRDLIELIAKGEIDQSSLYQVLTSIVLTNSRIDDIFIDLDQFKEKA